MKSYTIFPTLLLALALNAPTATAKEVGAKDARKALLQLTAYDKDGQKLRQTIAVLVDGQGTAVAAYHALKDAARIEAVDAKGKTYTLHRVLGANATTDLVKFSLNGMTKADYLALTTQGAAAGDMLTLLTASQDKKQQPKLCDVDKVEPFGNYNYYYMRIGNDSVNFTLPLLNSEGQLTAFVQQNVQQNATKACAIDARFVNDLQITAASALSSDLNALKLRRAIPADKREALSYISLLQNMDSLTRINAYNDFIAAYPSMPDGYVERAAFQASKGLFNQADEDFAAAVEKAKASADTLAQHEDAIHYTWSNLIYRRIAAEGRDSLPQSNWTLAKAEREADLAYAAAPYTLYLVQKGNCQFMSRNYTGAYDSFKRACDDSHFASSETFFSAARSLELAGGKADDVLALLDSCVARIPSQSAKYANFYLERSQRLLKAEKYRQAVMDYNEYEKLVGPRNLNEYFYSLRSQAEEKAHMYQQALDDLHTAISFSKEPIPYKIDEAALLLNVGEYERAIAAAEGVLKELPENPDCYKIIGVAQGELGKKAAALKNLNKAKQLGDDTVDSFIGKYSK